jgi:wyosine [tRNA(Phe)-imidazoG37] synthetase (radical SAM superfamily)
MGVPQQVTGGAPRYRIERSPVGYRVVGDGFLDWEPTLGEAASWREAMESPGWRRDRMPPIPGGGRAVPPGETLVYGPVRSRRLGRSLGVRLTPPGARVCTFDCVYCELGGETRRKGWPGVAAIEAALADRLSQVGRIDAITISGDGEPTLHPDFPAAVDAVLGVAAAQRPWVPVGILTNGSRAVRPVVRRALDRLDECIVMLDAAAERIDRPAGDCPLGSIVYAISLLRAVTVQACFVDGLVSNVDRTAVRQWVELVRELRPGKVQITTIDRPAWKCDVRPVPREQLEEIACLLRDRSGVEAAVFA